LLLRTGVGAGISVADTLSDGIMLWTFISTAEMGTRG